MLFEVRLPRLLAAFGVGGLLAVAGVLLQALFRNPLADPYVLGVSGGAAVGALLAMLRGRCGRRRSVRRGARRARPPWPRCICWRAAAARRACC